MALTYKKPEEDLLTGKERPVPIVRMDRVREQMERVAAGFLVAVGNKVKIPEDSEFNRIFGRA